MIRQEADVFGSLLYAAEVGFTGIHQNFFFVERLFRWYLEPISSADSAQTVITDFRALRVSKSLIGAASILRVHFFHLLFQL
jgi:hypothetical protein